MNNMLNGITGALGVIGLDLITSAQVRDEVTAWVTLIGSVAITLTTIGIQVYHAIRDRDKDKNTKDKHNPEDKDDG